MEKKLTIITTTYNSSRYLPLFFDNVLNLSALETYHFLLIMNVPDAKEKQIANSYQQKFPELFTIIEVDQRETIGASINRGFRQVKTPYCSYLDVDDIRVSDSYLRQIDTLENNPNVDFTYGDFMIVPDMGVTSGVYITAIEFDPIEFTRGCYASPTQLFRTSLLDKILGFDEQLTSGGDFDFQVRAALNCKFKKTPGLMCYYTKSPKNNSASSGIKQPLERTVIELRYGAYDKTMALKGFPYIELARKYRLDSILIAGDWQPIQTAVPLPTDTQNPDRKKLETAYFWWKIYHPAVSFYRLVLKTIKTIFKPIYQKG